jgi:hypothetical protein
MITVDLSCDAARFVLDLLERVKPMYPHLDGSEELFDEAIDALSAFTNDTDAIVHIPGEGDVT